MSKKCTPLWREAHFQVNMLKHTTCSDHFLTFRCGKNARRCGAKHMSKSKCRKHTTVSALLEVERLKKWTPLWREARFQVKSVKNWWVRTTFGRSEIVWRGKRKGIWTVPKVSKTWGFCSSCHYIYNYNTLHYTTVYYITQHCTTLHYIHPTTLHYIVRTELHCTHYTTLQYATLHYARYSTPQYIPLRYIPLHSISLHYITLHYT